MSRARGAGPRIVLTMIVKNESKVIRRCLESVRDYIDAWCISDTGSTDGTQDLIREILRDIPGKLIERPWVDFSTNRNEAIDGGLEFSPDWFLTLDADEELTTSAGFELSLEHDIHTAMFRMDGTSARWPRRVFFRPHLRYQYVLDEVIEDGESEDVLPACEIVSYTDGARSLAGMVNKYNADVEVLKRAVESEPESPRYWFYLAQRLMGACRWEEAIAAYEKRISIEGGFGEEVFQSAFMIGQIREEMGDEDKTGILNQYRKAWLLNPSRAEPLYAIAALASQLGQHPLAEIYARAAQRLQRPPSGLPVDESVYAWRAADLLAGTLAEQGKLSEAIYILERLLPLPQLPDSERPRVRENLELLKTELGPQPEFKGADEAAYERQGAVVREKGLSGFRHLAREYLANPGLQSLPSPARWLWICLVSVWSRWQLVGAALCVAACVGLGGWMAAGAALSPLLFILSRRSLQDTTVAGVTLGAIWAASVGNPWLLAVSVAALIGCKEAGIFMFPAIAYAWLAGGFDPVVGASALAAGSAFSVLVGVSLLRGTWLPVLRAGSKAHSTPYTQDNQRGAPHRLLVDLFMVSPAALVMAVLSGGNSAMLAGLIVAAHMLAPVRNARLVLAADLLLRVAAFQSFGAWAVCSAPLDIYVSRRIRDVYDPVTRSLSSALGFAR